MKPSTDWFYVGLVAVVSIVAMFAMTDFGGLNVPSQNLAGDAGTLGGVQGGFAKVDNGRCSVAGWVRDKTNPGTALTVYAYVDGPSGESRLLKSFVADKLRNDLPFPDKNHGYVESLAATDMPDGMPHAIYLYAANARGSLSMLRGSPKTINCQSAPPPPPPEPVELPDMEVTPTRTTVYDSEFANARHFNSFFCYDPSTGEISDWNPSMAQGCGQPRTTSKLDQLESFIQQNSDQEHTISLHVSFPDGTFTDRHVTGTVQVYESAASPQIKHDMPMHAYNLHDTRTQDLFIEAYDALLTRFNTLPNVIGYQIGYNIWQENLVGDYGFTPESFARFKQYWNSEGMRSSTLDIATKTRVSALVQGISNNNPNTWPVPIAHAGEYNLNTETPEQKARRFFYAYFQKFREKDIAAFQTRMYDTVREHDGDAIVMMYNAELYKDHALPSPIKKPGFVNLGELPMLPLIDPDVPMLFSLGKAEGMHLQGYTIERCATTSVCTETRGNFGICTSNKGRTCPCVVANGQCLDDWSIDRTKAYLRRGKAFEGEHRLKHNYVRSGYGMNAQGTDWTYDPSQKGVDFEELDYFMFNQYSAPGEPPWEPKIRDAPVQIHVYYPGWMRGAVVRDTYSHVYKPLRHDTNYITNLLESRGVMFDPVGDDWTNVDKVIVPYYEFISPVLRDIPGYSPSKVIPLQTLPVVNRQQVNTAYADNIIALLKQHVPGLDTPIVVNSLEQRNPSDSQWIMKVGARKNVVYNLDDTTRCVELDDGRSVRLGPFKVKILTTAGDNDCTPT